MTSLRLPAYSGGVFPVLALDERKVRNPVLHARNRHIHIAPTVRTVNPNADLYGRAGVQVPLNSPDKFLVLVSGLGHSSIASSSGARR